MLIPIQMMVVVPLAKSNQAFLVWFLSKDFPFVDQAVGMVWERVSSNVMISMLLLEMDAPLAVWLNLDGPALKLQLGYLFVILPQWLSVEMLCSSQLTTSNVMMETTWIQMDVAMAVFLILTSFAPMFLDNKLNVVHLSQPLPVWILQFN